MSFQERLAVGRDLLVGANASAFEPFAAGRNVVSVNILETVAVGQALDLRREGGPGGAGPEDARPLQVPEPSRQDLGRGHRAAIDENGQRSVESLRAGVEDEAQLRFARGHGAESLIRLV